ncbi:ankyrin repeat-containing domain protein [Lasiosphaeria hispida]|uniref:Ankyrin repeat-containing domain protein n=1 Tax=Lasiosphaeria hispida TaxID=260671 RepID=A0AAJ0HL18_9PEZI|nr:ankyrin repeat-containing domain protein [Lasiosphaeria hispida]
MNLLLARGANVSDQDGSGTPALHRATHARHKAMVSFLPENAANVEEKDEDSCTALTIAVKGKFEAGIKLLLSKGCPVNFSYKPRVSNTVSCT